MNCIRCGAEIDPERLECLPDTVTCMSCSRVPAKQAVCDPANGELVILDEARRPGGRGTTWSTGCTGRTPGPRRAGPDGGVLGPRDSVLSPRDTCHGPVGCGGIARAVGLAPPRPVPFTKFCPIRAVPAKPAPDLAGPHPRLPREWIAPC